MLLDMILFIPTLALFSSVGTPWERISFASVINRCIFGDARGSLSDTQCDQHPMNSDRLRYATPSSLYSGRLGYYWMDVSPFFLAQTFYTQATHV